jgi:NRPS condensation-like uncharacterized protein
LKDGTVLAVGIHHRLTDGYGFITLLHRFADWKVSEQGPPLFEHDRSLLKEKIASTISYEHYEYYTKQLFGPTIPQIPEGETDVIVKRYIKEELFRALNITSTFVSFNDVLVAWLTKIMSRIRRVPSDTTVKVGMSSDARRTLQLGENYFGNCVFYIYLPFLMAELESASVNDLSERVHKQRTQCMAQAYIDQP